MGYKKVTKAEVDIFLRLYQKYLLEQLDNMRHNLDTLPTDVINWCFSDIKLYEADFDTDKIESTPFGFGGLSGYQSVATLATALKRCADKQNEGSLIRFMEQRGHKVNPKKIGVEGE